MTAEEELKARVDDLIDEVVDLEEQNQRLESENDTLSAKVDELEDKLDGYDTLSGMLKDYFLEFGPVSDRDRLYERIQSLVVDL